jgi:structural maintenance of chromosome 4
MECQKLLEDCRQHRKDLSIELQSLKQKVKSLEIMLPKLTMQIAGFDATRSSLTTLVPELKAQSELNETDAAELLKLNKLVGKCTTDMNACSMKCSKLEADVARLQKSILDAGGAKMKKQKDKCDAILAKLNSTQKALSSSKVTITSCEKAANKAKEAKETAEKQLADCKVALEEKKAEHKALESDALEVAERYNEVMEIDAEKSKLLDEVLGEIEELRKSQSSVKVLELELLAKIEEHQKQGAEFEKKLKYYAKALDELRATSEEEEDDLDLSDDEDKVETMRTESIDGASTGSDDDDVAMETDTSVKESVEGAEAQKNDEPDSVGSEPDLKSALPVFTFAALEKYSKQHIKSTIEILQSERNTIAKNANMGAIDEYRKKEAIYLSK